MYRKILVLFILTLMLGVVEAKQQEVYVGIYVLNMPKLDFSQGMYVIDFYMDVWCYDCNLSTIKPEITNARIINSKLMIDEEKEKFWRFQVELLQPMDFHEYPFDRHTIRIEVEDEKLVYEKLKFIPDQETSGIESIHLPNFKIVGWNSTAIVHYYRVYDEHFSRYVFDIFVAREDSFKQVFPLFIFFFIIFATTLLSTDRRIMVSFLLLIAIVLFHSMANIPVGYITTFDKIVLVLYVAVACNILLSMKKLSTWINLIVLLCCSLIGIVLAMG
jgi:hypothetical protein